MSEQELKGDWESLELDEESESEPTNMYFVFEKGHQVVIKLKSDKHKTHPSRWDWEFIMGESVRKQAEYVTVDGRIVWPFKEEDRLR